MLELRLQLEASAITKRLNTVFSHLSLVKSSGEARFWSLCAELKNAPPFSIMQIINVGFERFCV